MDKTIIAFLRKEPFSDKSSNTDGYKLFYEDTIVAQWKGHRVLITNTEYGKKDMDNFISALHKWTRKSDIIFEICSKVVRVNAKSLLPYA